MTTPMTTWRRSRARAPPTGLRSQISRTARPLRRAPRAGPAARHRVESPLANSPVRTGYFRAAHSHPPAGHSRVVCVANTHGTRPACDGRRVDAEQGRSAAEFADQSGLLL